MPVKTRFSLSQSQQKTVTLPFFHQHTDFGCKRHRIKLQISMGKEDFSSFSDILFPDARSSARKCPKGDGKALRRLPLWRKINR